MLVIRIELWPHGDESLKRDLGTAHIINDGTGSPERGSYRVRLLKSPEYARRPGIWKTGTVTGFPRLRLGPWDLLYRALRATVGTRNPEPSPGAPPAAGEPAALQESAERAAAELRKAYPSLSRTFGEEWVRKTAFDVAVAVLGPLQEPLDSFLPEPFVPDEEEEAALLALHLVSQHANAAALGNSRQENEEDHRSEHNGPGGIRNHPESSREYFPSRVTEVLREAGYDI